MTKTMQLSNGVSMPQLGFGVFQIPTHADAKQATLQAIKAGYRLIDTAAAYMNERAVGEAIRESGVARDELFITTKLWVQDMGYEATQKAIDGSLARLGLDYLDLYLIHQPLNDVYGSWRAMEEAYDAGKLKAIGVANFENDRLQDLMMNSRIQPMVNQIELHPFNAQFDRVQWLQDHGVFAEAWGPFAEGKQHIFTNPVIQGIATNHGKTNGQVILRWLTQRGIVVIPKSVHESRIIENAAIDDFELTAAEMATMRTLDQQESLFGDMHDPETVAALGSVHFDYDQQ
ncbi:2,5-diketo-D-gluconic acid reductase [Lactiplantibacillus fabifermentans T30PCM01]|uniref:2,5-diketo-D-gluconic acid reductase n=1 Tax=Lactiplantibacillus fabifermentans T30PCM01 TaxID=1400520 RepID=W6T4F0_9LACO|nr:aldo/keto reductase [Lactiplantibacillus fabifermentans]ETY72568.1 2,5-diketo-D-gluconic acid reductase [Lactiplantibacillus fabifermentans T30PCM01]